jgi:hypothetical protein
MPATQPLYMPDFMTGILATASDLEGEGRRAGFAINGGHTNR